MFRSVPVLRYSLHKANQGTTRRIALTSKTSRFEVIPEQDKTLYMSNLGSLDSTHAYLECELRLFMWNVLSFPGMKCKILLHLPSDYIHVGATDYIDLMLKVISGQDKTFCMSNLGSADSNHTYLQCEPRLLM